MIRRLLCAILVCVMLGFGTMAVAGTPMPIPPSAGLTALGPQPEPPDCELGALSWLRDMFRRLFF